MGKNNFAVSPNVEKHIGKHLVKKVNTLSSKPVNKGIEYRILDKTVRETRNIITFNHIISNNIKVFEFDNGFSSKEYIWEKDSGIYLTNDKLNLPEHLKGYIWYENHIWSNNWKKRMVT